MRTLAIAIAILSGPTLLAQPSLDAEQVQMALDSVHAAAKKDPRILPNLYRTMEVEGKKRIAFNFRPQMAEDQEKDFIKEGDSADLVMGRMLEFIALKRCSNSFTKGEQARFNDLQKDTFALFKTQLDALKAKKTKPEEHEAERIKLLVADKRLVRDFYDFAETFATNRGLKIGIPPLIGEFSAELEFKTNPIGGTVYYTPLARKLFYDSEGYEDVPAVWKERWTTAPAKQTIKCGYYYFRVYWDKETIHKSGIYDITDKTVLNVFTPDKK